MNAIETVRTAITGQPPEWHDRTNGKPYPLDARDLEPLGQVGRHVWWSHKIGELRERPDTLTDFDVLPDRPYIQSRVDGERVYRVFELHAPGAYAAALAGPQPRSLRQPRMSVGDAFVGLPLLRPQDRGGEAIDNRLRDKGYRVLESSDGTELFAIGDSRMDAVDQVLAEAGPLVLAYRHGDPLRCTVTSGCLNEAMTRASGGGAWWCMSCTPKVES